MGKLDSFSVRYANWVLRNRLLTIAITLMIVFASAYGGQFIGFDTNYRVFFSKENPQLQAFDELQNVYTKTDNILFVIQHKDKGSIFRPEVLAAVKDMTEESWQLPFSTRVDSLSNYQHTYAEGDDLTVHDMVEGNPLSLSQSDLQYIRDVVMKEPLLVQRLISPDEDTTGVNITFNFPQKNISEVPETAAAARALLAKMEKKYPDLRFVPSGMVFMNNAFSEASQRDLQSLIPLMYAILIIAMILFLRSPLSTLATVLVIAFSAMTAMGLAGWAGVKLTPPSATAPTIILTLAIADSIHVIVSMFKEMQRGTSRNEAIVESIRINFQPVFLTSLTTMIGFLSLNFSDAPPFHDLGNMTATGVMFAFFYSVFFLPAVLSLLPIKTKVKVQGDKKDAMDKLGDFVVAKRRILLPVSSAVVIFLAIMIPKLELNDQFVQYFDHSIPFRGNTEFMIDNLSGIYQFEFSVGAKEAAGISEPEYLANLEKFSDWLRQQPQVMHVYSMVDIFKRLNKNMHGDDESWYRLPDERNLAAQYLLLYENSLPYGLDLNDRVNISKDSTRLTAVLQDMSTVQIRAFKEEAEEWVRQNMPEYMHATATSPVVMFSYISERNINSMVRGNIVALFLISLSILIALRSFRIGMFSLIPNLVPAIMGFGIWAIVVGQVNMAVAIVSAVSLGIIVDDTVHFLSKYHRARREKGLNSQDAVRYAFSTVGTALVVTTLVLAIGFSILAFSAFQINGSLGSLTAIMIVCALIADFMLLPPILMLFDKEKGQSNESKETNIPDAHRAA